jgi:hypothetical protein
MSKNTLILTFIIIAIFVLAFDWDFQNKNSTEYLFQYDIHPCMGLPVTGPSICNGPGQFTQPNQWAYYQRWFMAKGDSASCYTWIQNLGTSQCTGAKLKFSTNGRPSDSININPIPPSSSTTPVIMGIKTILSDSIINHKHWTSWALDENPSNDSGYFITPSSSQKILIQPLNLPYDINSLNFYPNLFISYVNGLETYEYVRTWSEPSSDARYFTFTSNSSAPGNDCNISLPPFQFYLDSTYMVSFGYRRTTILSPPNMSIGLGKYHKYIQWNKDSFTPSDTLYHKRNIQFKIPYQRHFYILFNGINNVTPGSKVRIDSVKVRSITVPSAPSLILPANGASCNPNILFKWSLVQFGFAYRIQIANNNNFTTIIKDSTISSDLIDSLRWTNVPNGVHYWRVRASNLAGDGPWSSVWNFTVYPNGMNFYSEEIPNAFALYNNFPNPFNPITKIRFDLPKKSFVKVIIYDIQGKEVGILINKEIQAGVYEYEFNGGNLTSGIYFYSFTAGDYVASKKMILLK